MPFKMHHTLAPPGLTLTELTFFQSSAAKAGISIDLQCEMSGTYSYPIPLAQPAAPKQEYKRLGLGLGQAKMESDAVRNGL